MLLILPGTLSAICLALFASWLTVLPIWPFTINGHHYINEIVLAIFIGILINGLIKLPAWIRPGTHFVNKYSLTTGIALVGSQISVQQIMELSGSVMIIILSSITFTILLTIWLAKKFHINHRFGILIAVSTAICGSAAVIAAAPVVRAYQGHITIAFTLTHLFSTLALLTLPTLAVILSLPEHFFGIWVGTSIQAVGQTIAAGFAYTDDAGNIATMVKMARVLMLAPVIFIIAIWYGHYYKRLGVDKHNSANDWQNYVPPFLIGFVGMVLLNSFALLPSFEIKQYTFDTVKIFDELSNYLILIALAGLGLNTRFKNLFKLGIKPFIIAAIAFTSLLAFSATLTYILI